MEVDRGKKKIYVTFGHYTGITKSDSAKNAPNNTVVKWRHVGSVREKLSKMIT